MLDFAFQILSPLALPLLLLQLLTTLASALRDLQQLADLVIVTGDNGAQGSATLNPNDSKDTAAVPNELTPDAAAATDNTQDGASLNSKQQKAAAAAGKGGKKAGKAKEPVAENEVAVSLAANANHKLQLVQSLLPMTRKEKYYGSMGAYK